MAEDKKLNIKVNKLMKDLENKNVDKLVNNYIKENHNPIEAYRKTFDKQLWRTEEILKVRSQAFFNSIEIQEVYEKKIEDLRDTYKDEINCSFNTITSVMKNDTYEHYDVHIDKNGTVIPLKYKKSISISNKLKAAELLLKVMGYFETNKKDVQVINSEYEIVKRMMEE